MKAQELRNAVLELAIQGKLVPQEPVDEPASALLLKIRAEKEQLVKDKKIKNGKQLSKITADEKPFDIPDSWEWVRLGDIYNIIMGQSPDGNNVSNSNEGLEFHQGKVYFSSKYLSESEQSTIQSTKIAEAESVLLSVRAPVGAVNITKRKICIGRGLCALQMLQSMRVEYCFYFLKSFENEFIKKATGTTFVAITAEVVKNQPFPLPPLAEQQRIVAKIEEIMPKIDEYEKLEQELTTLEKCYPNDLKKSILQYAVQGKLVPQRPADEPASVLLEKIKAEKEQLIKEKKIKFEKPLPQITYEKKPFEIPDSWEWVRIADIAKLSSGIVPPNINGDVNNGYMYVKVATMNNEQNQKVITVSDVYIQPYKGIENALINNCIIFPKRGGAIATNKKRNVVCPLIIDTNTMAMNINKSLNYEYVSLWFDGIDLWKLNTGTSVPQINNKDIYPLLIPIPPIAEQQRIVAQVEELMKLCDILSNEKSLITYKPKFKENKVLPFPTPVYIETEEEDYLQAVGFRSDDESVDNDELKELQDVVAKYTK